MIRFIIILFLNSCLAQNLKSECASLMKGKCTSDYEQQISQHATKTVSNRLHRTRRYLTFPSGSSFIMTISLIKSLMIKTPTGVRLAAECDVPFTLPSDTRGFKYFRGNHKRQRREIMDQLSLALEGLGFNGTACVQRTICDVRSYIELKGTSLVKDLLLATFKFDLEQEYLNKCNDSVYEACDFPLLEYLEGLSLYDADHTHEDIQDMFWQET